MSSSSTRKRTSRSSEDAVEKVKTKTKTKKQRPHDIVITQNNAVFFKNFFNLMGKIVTEVNMQITSSGLSIQAMDGSHVALVVVLLKPSGFSEFSCSKPTLLGIQVQDFITLFKPVQTDDNCSITFDDESDSLNVHCQDAKGSRELDYTVQLINLESELMGIPQTTYPFEITMSSAVFESTCRAFSLFKADIVLVTVTAQGIKFSVKGQITASYSYSTRPADSDLTDSDKESSDYVIIKSQKDGDGKTVEKLEMKFALRYLELFSHAKSLSDRVKISMADGLPISLLYDIPDIGIYRYYLAPKLDNEE